MAERPADARWLVWPRFDSEEAVDYQDVDALVEELQQRIATRRANGDYPAGLEEQLEAEFRIIMAAVHRDEVGTSELHERVARVGRAVSGLRADPELASRLPGGSLVHSTTATFVRRHTGVLVESVRALGREIEHALDEVRRLFEVQREADERQLNDIIGSLIDRLATLDHLADAVIDLEQRVDRLERRESATT